MQPNIPHTAHTAPMCKIERSKSGVCREGLNVNIHGRHLWLGDTYEERESESTWAGTGSQKWDKKGYRQAKNIRHSTESSWLIPDWQPLYCSRGLRLNGVAENFPRNFSPAKKTHTGAAFLAQTRAKKTRKDRTGTQLFLPKLFQPGHSLCPEKVEVFGFFEHRHVRLVIWNLIPRPTGRTPHKHDKE